MNLRAGPAQRARAALLCALLLTACGAAGCGLKPASAFIPAVEPGGIRPIPSFENATFRVTSKEFTEQLILGKIAVLALVAAGAEVEDHTNVQGSVTSRKSITGGENDLSWEYTGTGWINYLGQEDPLPDPRRQFEAVRDPPAPGNNTYTMVVTQKTQRKYGLKTLADMSKVPVSARTFCVEPEFSSRNDGLRGMLQTYGLSYGSTVPRGNVFQMSAGVVYNSTAEGKCTFGEAYETDARIQSLSLYPLVDNKKFFPNYNPAVTVREPVLRDHPELAGIFAKISPKLTTSVLRDLNSQVDVEGRDPVFVARDWMRDQGFIR
jgi:osmoprotectant transport system substrate-binding protein